jgi:outer membrane protein TolC
VKQAQAMTQSASGSLFPEVTANASFMRDKMSYNYVTPESATPQNWNSYGRTTLDMSWEIDFWGKNRAALAAATSGEMAAVAEKRKQDWCCLRLLLPFTRSWRIYTPFAKRLTIP